MSLSHSKGVSIFFWKRFFWPGLVGFPRSRRSLSLCFWMAESERPNDPTSHGVFSVSSPLKFPPTAIQFSNDSLTTKVEGRNWKSELKKRKIV